MGRESIADWRTIIIAAISLLVTFVFRKVNSVFIVIGGAGLGYLLAYL
jgi:chromate transporter